MSYCFRDKESVIDEATKVNTDLKSQLEEKSDKLDSESEKVEKLRDAQLDLDRKLCQLYNNIRNTFQLRNSPPGSYQFIPAGSMCADNVGSQVMTRRFPFTTLSEREQRNSKYNPGTITQ